MAARIPLVNVGGTLAELPAGDTLTLAGGGAPLLALYAGGARKAQVAADGAYAVYNAYIDASNYEQGFMRWAGGELQIGADAAGAGAPGNLRLTTTGSRLTLEQTGAQYGTTRLILTNGNGENGAIFDASDSSVPLVDFIFKAPGNQKNIRYETRFEEMKNNLNMAAPALERYEFQIGNPMAPSLVIGAAATQLNGVLAFLDQAAPPPPASGVYVYMEGGALKMQNYAGMGVLTTVAGTVAALIAAATAGMGARAFVTDATATHAAGIGTAVSGGGANPVPVYSDGAVWRIG